MTDMPSGFDIDHAASLLVCMHGRNAGNEARKKADLRMLGGDTYGMLAWHLVAKAIEERDRGLKRVADLTGKPTGTRLAIGGWRMKGLA